MASRAPRVLTRPWATLAFACLIAYGATLEVTVREHLATAHHHDHVGLVEHWLADATFVAPGVMAAVAIAVALVSRLLRRANAPTAPAVIALVLAASIAGATALGALRLVTHRGEQGVPLVWQWQWQFLGDVLLALAIALPIAGIAAAAVLAHAHGGGRSLRTAAALGCAAVLAGTAAWQAEADVPEASLLRDVISPCFNESPVGAPFTQTMPIPPVKQPVAPGSDVYTIVEKRGEAEIVPGVKTPVWGYDGIFPGPTILARKGKPVTVQFVNNLPPGEDPSGLIMKQPQSEEHHYAPSSTVVHLHGINADHLSDGYADDGDGHKHRINPGESFTHHYPNNEYQRPQTLWYHDHSIHITSPHVYRGMAGMYILQDHVEDATGLPGTATGDAPGTLPGGAGRGYGVYDIPLMLKDVMIDPATGVLIYDNCSHMGAFGDVMTVNGKQQPKFPVASRKYRFRLLDASDGRQYMIAVRKLSNLRKPVDDATANEPFTLIGTDEGLLQTPEPIRSFHTAPAERWEFVFDFSRYPVGTRLVVVNLLAEPTDDKLFPLMAFDVNRVEPDTSRIAGRPLVEHPADTQPPSATRYFEFSKMNGPYWSINGQIFDALRDDAKPGLNTTEDWVLDNGSGGWGHPVHIHLGKFKVLKVEGRSPRPGELQGWKDVVWLGPNQKITVRHQFWNYNDRFVFHCHNGSHEDFDMMSQFNVQPGSPGTTGLQ